MAYSYMDITHDAGRVVLEGLSPSFFVIVPYEVKQGVRVYSFDKAVYPSGEMVSDYQVKLNVSRLNLPEGNYRLFRATRFDRMLYDFTAGSRFDARTYQRNWIQLLHLYQEIIEGRLVLDLIGTQSYSIDSPVED